MRVQECPFCRLDSIILKPDPSSDTYTNMCYTSARDKSQELAVQVFKRVFKVDMSPAVALIL